VIYIRRYCGSADWLESDSCFLAPFAAASSFFRAALNVSSRLRLIRIFPRIWNVLFKGFLRSLSTNFWVLWDLRSSAIICFAASRISCNPMIRNTTKVCYAVAILDPSHHINRLWAEARRSRRSRKSLRITWDWKRSMSWQSRLRRACENRCSFEDWGLIRALPPFSKLHKLAILAMRRRRWKCDSFPFSRRRRGIDVDYSVIRREHIKGMDQIEDVKKRACEREMVKDFARGSELVLAVIGWILCCNVMREGRSWKQSAP